MVIVFFEFYEETPKVDGYSLFSINPINQEIK